MALSQSALASAMEQALKSKGFVTTGTHARTKDMCDALAKSIVDHITANAQVVVIGGSSSGTYKVK